MHDLQRIAACQPCFGVTRSGDDLLIPLHGNLLGVEAQRDQQAGDRQRAVGRALYTSLLAVLPLQGYVNAYAGVTLPNPASVRLHTSFGFTPVGVYEQVGFKYGK